MKRDSTFWILVLAIGALLFFLAFTAGVSLIPCGFSMNCAPAILQGSLHTPIPTVIPASMPTIQASGEAAVGSKCAVQAMTALEAWIDAGHSESEPFQFTDSNGAACQATFADVQVLFSEANLWFAGAPACITCHNSNIAAASANMDLSSYTGIVSGSRRASAEAKGNDILGGGVWANAMLNEVLNLPAGNARAMPLGRPPEAFPPGGPIVLIGQQVESP